MAETRFEVNPSPLPPPEKVLALFEAAGIGKPNWTPERLARAMRGSFLVVCAWQGDALVGYANAISDGAWVAYLSQLAVTPETQGQGVGRRLIELARERLGDEISLVLHSSLRAKGFYETLGFEPYDRVYRHPRRR